MPILSPLLGHGGSHFDAKTFNQFVDRFTSDGNLSLVIPSALERAIGLSDVMLPFNVSKGLLSGYFSGIGLGGLQITGMNHATHIGVESGDDETGRHHGGRA